MKNDLENATIKALVEGLHLNKSKVVEAKDSNNWFGVEGAKYISRGSWSDPQVSYKGYLYNYWDISEFVYNCMVEDYQEEGKELPAENTKEYDDLFTKYMYDEVPNAFIDLYPQELDPQVMEYLENGTISSGVVDLIKNASKISNAMTFEGLLDRLNSLKELTNIPEDKIDEAIKVTQEFADSVDYEDSFDEDERYEEVLPQIEDILSNMDGLFENKKVTEDIDEDKTKVIFRKELKDGDIIAVFPEDKQDNNMIGCYAHIGQHSTMSLDYYKETVPATPEEYKDLKAELENVVGYNLEVVTELDENKKVTETANEENSLDDIANYIKGIVNYNVSITPTGKGFSSYDVNFLNNDDSIMYSVMVNNDAIKDKVRLLNTLVLELDRLYRGKTFADGIREDLLNELNKIHPVDKKVTEAQVVEPSNEAEKIAEAHFSKEDFEEFVGLGKEEQFKKIFAYLTEAEYEFCTDDMVKGYEKGENTYDDVIDCIDVTIKELKSLEKDYPEKKDEINKGIEKFETAKKSISKKTESKKTSKQILFRKNKVTENETGWDEETLAEINEYGVSSDGISICGSKDGVIEELDNLISGGNFEEKDLLELINYVESCNAQYLEIEFPHFVWNSNADVDLHIYSTDDRGLNKKLIKTFEDFYGKIENKTEANEIDKSKYPDPTGDIEEYSLRNDRENPVWIIGSFIWNRKQYSVSGKVYLEGSKFGIDNGPISKLWIKDMEKSKVIVNYDRGWDVKPTDENKDLYEAIKKLLVDYREKNPYEVTESKKVKTESSLVDDYRIVSLMGGKKIMLNKKHSTQDFQKAMRDAYKKVKDTLKDTDNEVEVVLANVDPSFDWLDLENVK